MITSTGGQVAAGVFLSGSATGYDASRRPFGDYTNMFRQFNTDGDNDIYKLVKWYEKWQML